MIRAVLERPANESGRALSARSAFPMPRAVVFAYTTTSACAAFRLLLARGSRLLRSWSLTRTALRETICSLGAATAANGGIDTIAPENRIRRPSWPGETEVASPSVAHVSAFSDSALSRSSMANNLCARKLCVRAPTSDRRAAMSSTSLRFAALPCSDA